MFAVAAQVHGRAASLMVPHADLANHSQTPTALYSLQVQQQQFQLLACR